MSVGMLTPDEPDRDCPRGQEPAFEELSFAGADSVSRIVPEMLRLAREAAAWPDRGSAQRELAEMVRRMSASVFLDFLSHPEPEGRAFALIMARCSAACGTRGNLLAGLADYLPYAADSIAAGKPEGDALQGFNNLVRNGCAFLMECDWEDARGSGPSLRRLWETLARLNENRGGLVFDASQRAIAQLMSWSRLAWIKF